MRRQICSIMVAAAAIWITACEPPKPVNTSNSNANAGNAANTANANSKPVAAAPTKESLLEMDKKANEAFIKGDAAYFEGFLGDKFVMYEGGRRMNKAEMLKVVGGTKCEVKTWSNDEPEMHMIDADTYALVYKSTFDGTCGGEKMPSPMRAVSLYTRNGDKWEGAFHGETMIVDPKNPPKAAAPPPPAAKKDEEVKPPAADPNTETLMALERSGWEAWKARDAKKLEELSTKDLAFVGLFGDYTRTQADTIKSWTSGDCKINSTSVSDGQVTMLSPTVALMNFKASAEGTCDGQKIMPLYGSNVYVKDGTGWKLAFGFETPA